MTFDEYIKNPTKSFVMSNRSMYQNLYENKWNLIKVRENGAIAYKLYNSDEDYYIHMKIPSEVVPKFYYDTIVRFYLPKDKRRYAMEKTLENYDIQVYSNDPSFVYTFAHAFKTNGMLIKDLEGKMSKLALHNVAKERNPKDETGYVKSLYFLYIEMRSLKLFNKIRWDAVSQKYNKNVWNSTVIHADDRIKDRQEEEAAMRKKTKRESHTTASRDLSKPTAPLSSGFKSPNEPNFGHFKKENFNIINKIKKSATSGFGHFKKPSKG